MSSETRLTRQTRKTNFLSWKNSIAWMERMHGKQWEHLLEYEYKNYHKLLYDSKLKNQSKIIEQEIKDAEMYIKNIGFTIGNNSINITFYTDSKLYWNWSWSKQKKLVSDIDVLGNIVWYIVSDDNLMNLLVCEDSQGKIIWKKNEVSSQIAVIENRCYYIKTIQYFITTELCCCDARTGRNENVLYREKDKEKEIILQKMANRTLYLQSSDALQSKLYRIDDLNVIPLYQNSLLQYPVGTSIYGNNCVFTKQSIKNKWIAHGKPIQDWIIPSEEIQWVHLESGYVITIFEGSQTIWYCSSHKKPVVLFSILVGKIEPNPWSIWENILFPSFLIKCPFDIPYIINIINGKIQKKPNMYLEKITRPITFNPLHVQKYYAISKDKTNVPYIIIKEKGVIPTAQLIYVYGSYGTATKIQWVYEEWYPFLKRKWAIVFALVRGGGDIDAEWADASRRENRHLSVDDYQAVIFSSQQKLKLKAHQTVLYGRSAGGVPVGAMISRFPYGNLFGAVFTESPYVDILRTATNPTLPLTIGEYKEFGNPLHNILEFKELLNISPINSLPAEGAPGVFVLTHVGLLDRQVYPYESFKWVQHLRGFTGKIKLKPYGKYITFEEKEGHRYEPTKLAHIRAKDFSIIEAWKNNELRSF